VEAWPLKIDQDTLYNLEDNLLLFFTGYSRAASHILKEQDQKTQIKEENMIENLHFIKDIAFKSKEALLSGDLSEFASLMNVHWQYKKQRSKQMSNSEIDEWYQIALQNGALGGKMIGAGGGGFLMFYANDKVKLRQTMRKIGLHEIRFRFDFSGTQLIAQS
jgi:D-glycero-alpha-D-manno-heptose-7-phosphate kinase